MVPTGCWVDMNHNFILARKRKQFVSESGESGESGDISKAAILWYYLFLKQEIIVLHIRSYITSIFDFIDIWFMIYFNYTKNMSKSFLTLLFHLNLCKWNFCRFIFIILPLKPLKRPGYWYKCTYTYKNLSLKSSDAGLRLRLEIDRISIRLQGKIDPDLPYLRLQPPYIYSSGFIERILHTLYFTFTLF